MEGLPMDEALQAVLAAASEYAALQGLPRIHSPHLFAALLSDGSGALVRTLQEKEIPVPQLIRVMLSMIPPQERVAGDDVHVEVSATVGQVLAKAVRRAREDGRSRIGERDVLRALFANRDGVVVQALRQLRLGWLLHEPLTDDAVRQPAEDASGRGILAAFAADLTEKLGRGQLQKPVGRYEEIGALMHALIAPDAPVPLLVGQAGVGKKAIVEGLADWIRSDLCPGELRARHVLEVATPSLMAATRFGSDLEQRLQALFTADRQRTVLFFDRIDCLVNEELPGAVHLWQMAAEHRLLMLGSCPPDSFEKAIEPDPRWSARFRVLHIQPPSAETTCEILRAHRELLELEHQVTISEAAIEAAVALSGQRVSETAWPGKALDALRQACRQVARDQTLRRRVVDEQDIAKTWREAIE
jgi:ATP-dependent Clp protease ATP-binding subunit ClpB